MNSECPSNSELFSWANGDRAIGQIILILEFFDPVNII
jgi:hypothetical protein